MDIANDEHILDLLERLKIVDHINEDEITSTITKVIQACHVPRVDKTEDEPYDTSDFLGVADNAESQLCVISRILEALCNAKNKGQQFSSLFEKNVVIYCLLVASEYTEIEWEWTSNQTSFAAKQVIENLCGFVNCSTLKELLNGLPDKTVNTSKHDKNSAPMGKEVNYLDFILQILTTTLNKKNWKACTASKASYWYILVHLDQKSLGNYLAYMLPPALFIVDDWEQKNKIFGLQCLQHILKNTTGSEIRWYGRAVVIFEAIKPLRYSKEVEVLEVLYPTITLAAEILEADPANTGHLQSMSSFDTIMQQLILEMRYEQKLALRMVYAAVLPAILNAMGILAIKWSEELIPMFEDYLATYSGPMAEDRINILKGLQVYIRECWPQVHVNAASILKMIVRLVYDVTDQDSNLDSQVMETLTKAAIQVVRLLYAAAPKTTRELYHRVASSEVHPECQILLKEIETVVSLDTGTACVT